MHKLFVGLIWTACACAQFSGCSSTTNAHSETGQMTVCCQNLPLGALSTRSAPSVLVGALFKKFGLFLNTPRISVRDQRDTMIILCFITKAFRNDMTGYNLNILTVTITVTLSFGPVEQSWMHDWGSSIRCFLSPVRSLIKIFRNYTF